MNHSLQKARDVIQLDAKSPAWVGLLTQPFYHEGFFVARLEVTA